MFAKPINNPMIAANKIKNSKSAWYIADSCERHKVIYTLYWHTAGDSILPGVFCI